MGLGTRQKKSFLEGVKNRAVAARPYPFGTAGRSSCSLIPCRPLGRGAGVRSAAVLCAIGRAPKKRPILGTFMDDGFAFYFGRCKMLLPGARLDSGRGYCVLIHFSKISTRGGAPQHARTSRYPPSKFAVFAFWSVCFPIFGGGN